ncbi:MAG: DegV family protein [Anaerolineae bacterium]|nr:DegV family protein [Anaerolineae bacterium]
MFNILTDSCNDLSPSLIAEHGIHVIPLSVFAGGKVYKDGVDIDNQLLYRLVETTGELPKTSAISAGEFEVFFEKLAGPILYIGIGSSLSATHNSALMAAANFPKRDIRVIDSLNLSSAIGHLVLRAAQLRKEGKTLDEVEADVRAMVPRVYASFMVEKLDYLYLGGRCTALQSFFGSMLKIRPIIYVKSDGTMDVLENTRGTRRRGLNAMLKRMDDRLAEIDPHRVFITHSGGDGIEQDVDYLREELRKRISFDHIEVTTAGCTISSHCGPLTIGILYTFKPQAG